MVALMVMMPLAVNPLTVNVSKGPDAGSEYVDVAVTPEKLQAQIPIGKHDMLKKDKHIFKSGKKNISQQRKDASRDRSESHAAAHLMTNALVLSLTLVPACRG